MTLEQILIGLIGVLALTALFLGIGQAVIIRGLRRDLRGLAEHLPEPQSAPAGSSSAPEAQFGEALRRAERQPPPEPAAAPVPRSDKYRYVAALAEQGMDARGIARALQLGTAEVEQLLRLARLQQPAG